MNKTKTSLRQKAEEKLNGQNNQPQSLSQTDALRLLHELQVHQVELEMQNEELIQARAEAEEGYRLYNDLYEFAPVGYFSLARDGTIRKVNLAGATLLGVERGKLVNRRLGAFIDMEYRPIFNAFLEKLSSCQGRETCEIQYLKNKTEPLWAHLEAACFEGGEEARVVMADITERKQAERVLRESERTLRESQILGRVGNWEHDFVTQKLKWSDEVFALYERDKTLGQPSLEEEALYYSQEEFARLREFARLARETGRDFEYDFTVNLPSGKISYFHGIMHPVKDQTGKIIKLVGVFQDITGRKQAEQVLRESEARYRTLLESTSDSVYVLDREWRHIVVNEAATRFVQMPKAKLLGNKLTDLFPGIEETVFFKTFQRVMDTRESDTTVAMYTFPDGKQGWYEVRVDPIPEGILCISRDITERKQAEMELIQSEAKFRNTFDQSPVGSVIVGLDKRFIRCNPAFCNFLGYPESELIGKTISDITHPEDLEIGMKELKQMVEGEIESFTAQKRYLRKDGAVLWGEISIRLVCDANDEPLYFLPIIQNITERKQAEEELRESEEKYRRIVETAGEGIWMIDTEGNTSFANQKMAEMLGCSVGEMLGVSFFNFMDEDGKAIAAVNLERRRQGINEQHDFKFRRKDGTDLWAILETNPIRDRDGRYAGALAMITDITERERVENELEESHRKLQEVNKDLKQAQAIAHIGNWKWNLKTSTVEWSDEMYRIFGIDKDSYTGRLGDAISKVIHPDDLHIVLPSNASEFAGKKPQEYRIIHPKSGEIRHIRAKAGDAILDEQGTPIYLTGIAQDITESKQAEELIEQYADELEQRVAERTAELIHANRAKDEFLANMSHELRTPLNSVLGFSETLLEGVHGPINEKQSRAAEMIHTSGQHLLGLINDILDVSKIEAGKFELQPENVSVNMICQSSLMFVKQPALKKSIELEYTPSPSHPILFADPKRLKQILVNLLSNAVKFTPERGTIKLETWEEAETNQMHFAVTDTGIGIAPQDLEKLFKPFTQLDGRLSRQYEGSGLGLSLVKKLAELHGGRVEVESNVGRGSCFHFYIPIQDGQIVESEKTAAQGQGDEKETPKTGKTILLVEDNDVNMMVTGDYLTSKGYKIIEAKNGAEAIKQAQSPKPDLILMDIQMPEMDGYETIQRLRADPQFAATPIIAITALAMPGDRELCLAAGATEYLTKPIQLKGLVGTIESLLN